MEKTLIEFKNLHTYFFTDAGLVKAVSGISFHVVKGQTTCIVGESGCGKSVMALSLMRLIQPPGRIVEGEILYDGHDLVKLSRSHMEKINGNKISMIFQEPMTSLNPVFTSGEQIAENIILHNKISKHDAQKKAVDMIKIVGIPRAEGIYKAYPHELSGGMRQRIMIAMALSCNPELLIADEPTTALDVTIQAQILELLKDMKREFGMSIMLITHDLGVVAEMADYVIVMYAGKIVEEGKSYDIFKSPKHPYTIGLLKSKPSLNQSGKRLYSIPGNVPNPIGLKDICYFSDRCDKCMEICLKGYPPETIVEEGHKVACRLYGEVKE